jgi:hypothetical protein
VLHISTDMSSFPVVVKKFTTIPEYPSSARSPQAMALKHYIIYETKRRIKESVQL